jgi:hypothetical protein
VRLVVDRRKSSLALTLRVEHSGVLEGPKAPTRCVSPREIGLEMTTVVSYGRHPEG